MVVLSGVCFEFRSRNCWRRFSCHRPFAGIINAGTLISPSLGPIGREGVVLKFFVGSYKAVGPSWRLGQV
jgi:hypothetical protein